MYTDVCIENFGIFLTFRLLFSSIFSLHLYRRARPIRDKRFDGSVSGEKVISGERRETETRFVSANRRQRANAILLAHNYDRNGRPVSVPSANGVGASLRASKRGMRVEVERARARAREMPCAVCRVACGVCACKQQEGWYGTDREFLLTRIARNRRQEGRPKGRDLAGPNLPLPIKESANGGGSRKEGEERGCRYSPHPFRYRK